MARRCSDTAAAAQRAACTSAAQAEEEMTMCHHGAAVSAETCCDGRWQLWELNRIMDSINDILAQILQELQRQNGAQ